jgi:hypothetical protein
MAMASMTAQKALARERELAPARRICADAAPAISKAAVVSSSWGMLNRPAEGKFLRVDATRTFSPRWLAFFGIASDEPNAFSRGNHDCVDRCIQAPSWTALRLSEGMMA